jgi:hypothetical protein
MLFHATLFYSVPFYAFVFYLILLYPILSYDVLLCSFLFRVLTLHLSYMLRILFCVSVFMLLHAIHFSFAMVCIITLLPCCILVRATSRRTAPIHDDDPRQQRRRPTWVFSLLRGTFFSSVSTVAQRLFKTLTPGAPCIHIIPSILRLRQNRHKSASIAKTSYLANIIVNIVSYHTRQCLICSMTRYIIYNAL